MWTGTKNITKFRMKKIGIIGGGILGLSIGYNLAKKKNFNVKLFEKENTIGAHQSGNNSGVLHCGLYYKPGSLKAKLAVKGIREMIKFCKDKKINFDQCGKLVVATTIQEKSVIESLANRGKKNGLKGLKFLNKKEQFLREPNVNAIKSLLVPEEGIVDYGSVMKCFSDVILENDGEIFLNTEVKKITNTKSNKILINTNQNEYEFDLIVNCTGLFSDRVYNLATRKKRPLRIIPFRGEYMSIKKEFHHIVNHLIYPVPDPKYPFLGVHYTRMINGDREVGPNAVLAFKREGYKNTDFSIYDLYDSIMYRGFTNFLLKNFKFASNEFITSVLMSSFLKKAKKLIPDININMIEKGNSGVRAQAMEKNGNLLMDFSIIKENNQIHVLNAPSPGATACISISKYIIDKYI